MNRPNVRRFSLAVLLGIIAGSSTLETSPVLADDTEVYLGNDAVHEGIRPNILFILDTSGSMSATVKGTGMDRLDNMKDAMRRILDEMNNVNVGLMRFTDPGGPILFPVSYINEDVSVAEGAPAGVDVNVRVDQRSDDAEERHFIDWGQVDDEDDSEDKREEFYDQLKSGTGTVTLTSPVLDLVETDAAPASAGGVDLEYVVASDADDVEQYCDPSPDDCSWNDGTVLNGSTFGIGYDDGHQQWVGVRFGTVEVPAGATILNASLVFTANNDDSDPDPVWRILGEASTDAAGFTTSDGMLTSRSFFTGAGETQEWDPGTWNRNEEHESPDIAHIVQKIVDQAGWSSGNAMVFAISNKPGTLGSNDDRRRSYTYKSDDDKAPRLKITYTTEPTKPGVQYVGVRFRNVGVPRGATINSAHIEFTPDQASSSPLEIRIHGIDEGNTPTFSTADNDISGRSPTYRDEDWVVAPWDTGVKQQTPDLKYIVQEIVDRTDWCGNNAMGFVLKFHPSEVVYKKNGPAFAESFDASPTNAPVLRIDYDEDKVPAGACIDQWHQTSIAIADDDAEQDEGGAGSMSLGGNQLDIEDDNLIGMRFTNLPILKDQQILEAYIEFTARDNDTGSTELEVYAQAHDDAPRFENSGHNLSGRTKSAARVPWFPGDWSDGAVYRTPDIASIIQETVSRSGWVPGNSIALLVEHVGGPNRRAHTFNDDPARAPVLKIKVRGQLASGAGVKTVRTELKEIIDNLDHIGHTPIVDTLYEAARYFRGDPVHWGLTRGHDRDGTYSPNPNAWDTNEGVRRNTRVSHPSSWVSGDVVRSGACADDNLNHEDCITEYIKGTSTATYVSPIEKSCQANYVILLTDGQANHNHSDDLIRKMTGVSDCTGNSSEECGRELTKWLSQSDQSPLAGDQNVVTYTVGFNFSSDWLRLLATDSGGKFSTATDADSLVAEFRAFLADILNRTTSFATPALSVNAFNKLFHRSDVYFSLFKPNAAVRWDGNVKKYQLCSDSSVCSLGEVLDANGDPAIDTDPLSENLGRIKDSALSFWSAAADGTEIKAGGAGLEIPAPASRRVLTYTGTGAPSKVSLNASPHRLEDTDADGILDGLSGTTTENRERTQELFGDAAHATSDSERNELIEWIRGEDVDGLEDVEVLAAANRRFAFHDPLHSSPVAVTYGGTEAEPVLKLFVGTNDGGLRAINAYNGAEEWVFYPQSVLGNLPDLRANFNGDHVYGIDGTPTAWINDRDNDGIIEPGTDTNSNGVIDEDEGDFVRLFVGMRRGGNQVFALDVTPSVALGAGDKDDTNDIDPVYMWRIEGGTTNFPRLGQTWSRPRLAKMEFGTDAAGGTETRMVLVFAGGYDTVQDSAFTASGLGNAIYIVDAVTGERLFVVSGSSHSTTDEVVVPGMDYPIPSEVAMMDADGDGNVDRLLVGDTGGQLWRVDISANLAANEDTIKPVVGKLATVSNAVDPADKRKFFYPPDVVRVTTGDYSTSQKYDLVVAVTGNRAHPLDDTVDDRMYAIRDTHTSKLVDGNGDGLADSYTTYQGALVDPSLAGDFFDVTDVIDFTVQSNVDDLTNANGWYMDLAEPGEKGLAPPIVLAGQMFFTTYLPQGVVNANTCAIAEGTGRLYGVNVLTGAPVNKDWDDVDDSYSKNDRVYELGSGIPSQAVPIFQEEGITLLIGGGGGATAVDPDIGLPRDRTYWVEQRR